MGRIGEERGCGGDVAIQWGRWGELCGKFEGGKGGESGEASVEKERLEKERGGSR